MEVGTAVALYETESKIKILDGISINAYAGKEVVFNDNSTVGLGIEKEIINIHDIVNVGAGVYATKRLKDLFDGNRPNFNVGISGTIKF